MSPSAKEKIEKLRAQLDHHNHLYHVLAKPEISDREYDRMMAELIELERAHPEFASPDSPTQRIGGDVQAALQPVRHAVPMMSIDNTYSEQEVRAFDERVRRTLDGERPAYVLEPKIDGASVSLRYEGGKLVLAATRGRGNVGDDITVNARVIKSIPLTLRTDGAKVAPPRILEVRGEVYMDNDDFQRVNKEIQAEGEEPYANPRNLTSGTIRRLDPKIVAKRRLRFMAHGLGQVEPMSAKSYWDWTQLLRAWGLPLPKEVWHVGDVDEAIKCIHEFERIRPKLPFMTDGMVMKVDSFSQRDRLGATSKAPRWVIAYKYETEQQPTVLKDVEWQVGKGGNLTPVGKLVPVFIGGVTVSNVSLHNIEQIARLDLHKGDTVIVERAGEVIPYVVDVVKTKRPADAKRVAPPKKCPSCGSEIEPGQGTPILRCPNRDCPAQVRERMFWFAHRSQMDIDGLGERIIEQLIKKGYVRDYADLYRLEIAQLSELTHETQIGEKKAESIVASLHEQSDRLEGLLRSAPPGGDVRSQVRQLSKQAKVKGLGDKTVDQLVDSGLVKFPRDLLTLNVADVAGVSQTVRVGEISAQKILAAITASKSRGLARVLTGLGIRLVGSTAAHAFAQWAGTIDRLMAASIEELASVLAKDPGAKQASVAKEREYADALYNEIHGATKVGLFEVASSVASRTVTGEVAEQMLTKRDRMMPRDRRLGKGRIQKLSDCFPTMTELEAAKSVELLDCLLEGRAVARSLYDYLHSPTGIQIIQRLKDVGVKLSEESVRIEQSEWTGKTVVITGSFEGFSRDAIKKRLAELGAYVTESVSSKTDSVFVGIEPGSKYQKAVSLNLKIEGAECVARLMKSSS